MISVDVLRAMYAAGAPVEAIFAAIETDQKKEADSQNAELARRRSLDAARQQKVRDGKRHAKSRDVTLSHATSRESQDVTPVTDNEENQSLNDSTNLYIESSLLPSSEVLLEKKEGVVVARASKPRANRGQVVPEDMKLSIKNLDYALSEGWTRERAFREWGRFRDGSISKGRIYKNFDAGWRNWVTSDFQAKGNQNGQQSRNSSGTRESSILAAARDVAARHFGTDEMAGTGDDLEFPDWNHDEAGGAQRCRNGSGSHTEGPGCEQSGSSGVLQGEIIAPDEGSNGLFSRIGAERRD